MKVQFDIIDTIKRIKIVPKRVSRVSMLVKCSLMMIAGILLTDSLNSLFYHYLGKTDIEDFVARPGFAILGLVFVLFVILFTLFAKTRWDKG